MIPLKDSKKITLKHPAKNNYRVTQLERTPPKAGKPPFHPPVLAVARS